jgi:hypothetical protein
MKLLNYPDLRNIGVTTRTDGCNSNTVYRKSAKFSVGSINETFSVSNQLFDFHGLLGLNTLM